MTKQLDTAIDHAADGIKNILSQYKDAPKFNALVDSILSGLDDFESQFELFKTQLSIDVATGTNLDNIGDLLGAPSRGAYTDDEYRKILYSLIAAYNSTGTAKEIVYIVSTLVDATYITIREVYDAAFEIYLREVTGSPDYVFLKSVLEISKAAGVELYKITETPSGLYFGFEEDTDPDAGTFSVIYFPEYVAFDYTQAYSSETILKNVASSNFILMFVMPDNAAATSLVSQLNWDDADGYMELVDKSGVTWKMTRSTAAGSYTYINGAALVVIDLETGSLGPGSGTPICTITKDDVPVTLSAMNFATWYMPDAAAFAAANPNGLTIDAGGLLDSTAGAYSLIV